MIAGRTSWISTSTAPTPRRILGSSFMGTAYVRPCSAGQEEVREGPLIEPRGSSAFALCPPGPSGTRRALEGPRRRVVSARQVVPSGRTVVERGVAVHRLGPVRGGGGVRVGQVGRDGAMGPHHRRDGWQRGRLLRLHPHGQQVDGTAEERKETVKSLTTTLPLTLALGGLVALLVFVLPLEAGERTSAWIGTLVASVLGAVAMVIKTQLSGMGLTGTAAMKALITAQGLSLHAAADRRRAWAPCPSSSTRRCRPWPSSSPSSSSPFRSRRSKRAACSPARAGSRPR